jgi:hypothetical protein
VPPVPVEPPLADAPLDPELPESATLPVAAPALAPVLAPALAPLPAAELLPLPATPLAPLPQATIATNTNALGDHRAWFSAKGIIMRDGLSHRTGIWLVDIVTNSWRP